MNTETVLAYVKARKQLDEDIRNAALDYDSKVVKRTGRFDSYRHVYSVSVLGEAYSNISLVPGPHLLIVLFSRCVEDYDGISEDKIDLVFPADYVYGDREAIVAAALAEIDRRRDLLLASQKADAEKAERERIRKEKALYRELHQKYGRK